MALGKSATLKLSTVKLSQQRGVLNYPTTQLYSTAKILLELLFVREGVFSCPLLSADNIDMFVDFICISCSNK